jgi:hypothetical protein
MALFADRDDMEQMERRCSSVVFPSTVRSIACFAVIYPRAMGGHPKYPARSTNHGDKRQNKDARERMQPPAIDSWVGNRGAGLLFWRLLGCEKMMPARIAQLRFYRLLPRDRNDPTFDAVALTASRRAGEP